MDFAHALQTAVAELTPQPWEYSASDGATLTVIPAGLTAEPGDAEVYLRVTADKTTAAEAGVTTEHLPELIDAIEQRTIWAHLTVMGDGIETRFDEDALVVTVHEDGDSAVQRLPEMQRMPFASALRRALDVARGWER